MKLSYFNDEEMDSELKGVLWCSGVCVAVMIILFVYVVITTS